MEILIVRHGDPDYEHDTLTEKGVVEAKLLAEKLSKMKIPMYLKMGIMKMNITMTMITRLLVLLILLALFFSPYFLKSSLSLF